MSEETKQEPASLKERAEELSFEELGTITLKSRIKLTAKAIANWLLYPYPPNVLRVLSGPKGIGKTFAVMEAIRLVGREPPCFYVYKRLGKVEDISWKFSGEFTLSEKREPWAYIFDDVHYLAEAVFKGEERIEVLTSFMMKAVEKAESGRPVVVISEDMPSLYFENLEVNELKQLSEKFRNVSLVEAPSFVEWSSLVDAYGIKGDELGKISVYLVSHKPRFLIRLVNLVGELSLVNIRSYAKQLLEAKAKALRRGEKEGLLVALDNPVIGMSPSESLGVETVLELGEVTLREMEEHLSLLREVTQKVANKIRERSPNPYVETSHYGHLWATDNAFVIRIQKEFPESEVEQTLSQIAKEHYMSWHRLWAIKPLVRTYCLKNYEKARPVIQRFNLKDLITIYRMHAGHIYADIGRFSGWFSLKPFQRAFNHLLDTPTSEVIDKMLEDARWRHLFEYAKAHVAPSNFDDEFLLALREVFRSADELVEHSGTRRLVKKALLNRTRLKPLNTTIRNHKKTDNL